MTLCPIIATYLKGRPEHLRWAAFGMGLIPFVTGTLHLYIAPIAWPMWAGWPKGIEVSALDFLAIAVIIATRKGTGGLKQVWPWAVYFVAVLIALPHAQAFMAGTFYVWQLMRIMLVGVAAVRLAHYPGVPEFLLKGVFVGLFFQVLLSATQVAGGATQASGEFASQNLLGMMAHFALFPAFALLLANRSFGWATVGFLSAVIVDLLTASRATLGLAAIGLTILSFVSIAKSSTSRKYAIMGFGALAIAISSPFAFSAIKARQSGNSVESSNAQRAAMENAALMIIKDYPFGTGPDQYVVVANVGGYSDRAGVAWSAGNRATAVHNSYLLIWAETGLLGLAGMLIVLFAPIISTFRAAFRFRRDPESEILLGCAVAMLMVAAHLLYEWVFILFLLQYMFAMIAGIAIGTKMRLTAGAKHRKAASIRQQQQLAGELSPAR
jgi:hypothetical protein